MSGQLAGFAEVGKGLAVGASLFLVLTGAERPTTSTSPSPMQAGERAMPVVRSENLLNVSSPTRPSLGSNTFPTQQRWVF